VFDVSSAVLAEVMASSGDEWIPAIHEIEKWWDIETLHLLGRAMAGIRAANCEPAVTKLAKDCVLPRDD